MKSLERSVNDLIEEIKENGQNRKEFIESKENEILKKIDQIGELKTKNFFKLPIKNIFSIISKYDFCLQGDDQFSFLNFIISNIHEEHSKEDEILFLLKHIHFSSSKNQNEYLNIGEIIDLLKLFKNVDLFQQLSTKYHENEQLLSIDYSHEMKKRDKTISKLQEYLKEYKSKYVTYRYQPLTEQPFRYQPDIFDCCRCGKLDSVRYIIENEGGDKNRQDSNGYQPIHWACKFGSLNIVEYLIEKANVDVEACNSWGTTPLISAFENGNLDIVKYLIEQAHANTEVTFGMNNSETILTQSCSKGDLLFVKYLIEDAEVDITKYSKMLFNPLNEACRWGHLPVAQYLIEKIGFNPNGNKFLVMSPLQVACCCNSLSIVQYLIEKCKVDPNQNNCNGESPLFIAVKFNNLEIVKYLIEKINVNIDLTNFNGENAIHKSIGKYNPYFEEYNETLKYCIEQIGININTQDAKGNTLLHIAYEKENPKIAEYLIQQGIDQTLKNNDGKLAISLIH